MINFNKNKLLNRTLEKFYETFAITQDTADFVPPEYNKWICGAIFKDLKKAVKRVNKEDKKFQKAFKKQMKHKAGVKCRS